MLEDSELVASAEDQDNMLKDSEFDPSTEDQGVAHDSMDHDISDLDVANSPAHESTDHDIRIPEGDRSRQMSVCHLDSPGRCVSVLISSSVLLWLTVDTRRRSKYLEAVSVGLSEKTEVDRWTCTCLHFGS